MDNKFYVSLEAARLLKEKGFNEATDYIIDEDNCMMDSRFLLNSELPEYVCSCPTKAEVIDWLENEGVIIVVFSARIGENRKWCHSIINTKTGITIETPYKFSTRLEAEDAAIIKACKLLENGN